MNVQPMSNTEGIQGALAHLYTGEGYGRCSNCGWYNQPEGCNVTVNSKQCKLNRYPRTLGK